MRLLIESNDDIVLAARAARRRNRQTRGLVRVLVQASCHGHLPLVKYLLEHPRCSSPLWAITPDAVREVVSGAAGRNHCAVVEFIFMHGWRHRKGVDRSLTDRVKSLEVL